MEWINFWRILAIWNNYATGGRLCEVSNNNKSATMATETEAVEAVEVAVPAAAGRPSSVLRLQHQWSTLCQRLFFTVYINTKKDTNARKISQNRNFAVFYIKTPYQIGRDGWLDGANHVITRFGPPSSHLHFLMGQCKHQSFVERGTSIVKVWKKNILSRLDYLLKLRPFGYIPAVRRTVRRKTASEILPEMVG